MNKDTKNKKNNIKTKSKEEKVLKDKDNVGKIDKAKPLKKVKLKRNISSGIAYVNSTFNNTIISIADEHGNIISWSSAGAKGFKGSRKSTPYAAQIAADAAGEKAYDLGLRVLSVQVKGPGSGRETALRALKFFQLKIQHRCHITE